MSRKTRFRPTLNDGMGYLTLLPLLRRLRIVCGASLVISATCATDRAGDTAMTDTQGRCRHGQQRTAVRSVAWTYAFSNRPIACRTGQVAKGNVRVHQRCPRAQGYVEMSRCAALFVRSGLAAIHSGKRPHAHLYIEIGTRHRSVDSSMAFLAGSSSLCRGLLRR